MLSLFDTQRYTADRYSMRYWAQLDISHCKHEQCYLCEVQLIVSPLILAKITWDMAKLFCRITAQLPPPTVHPITTIIIILGSRYTGKEVDMSSNITRHYPQWYFQVIPVHCLPSPGLKAGERTKNNPSSSSS